MLSKVERPEHNDISGQIAHLDNPSPQKSTYKWTFAGLVFHNTHASFCVYYSQYLNWNETLPFWSSFADFFANIRPVLAKESRNSLTN